jgi:hypothetical protein
VAVVPADPQDRPLADDLARIDVVVLGQQAQAELEQFRDRLVPGHFLDQQVVLPIFLQGEEVHPVAGGKTEGHVSMPWASLAIVGGVAPSRHSSEELCVADAAGHGRRHGIAQGG